MIQLPCPWCGPRNVAEFRYSGEAMAEAIATRATPEIISAFGLGRFSGGELVGEKGAAAVGH